MDSRGGAERSLLGLLDGLDRATVAPAAIVLGQGSMAAALTARGVPTTSLSLTFAPGASYRNLAGRVAASAATVPSLARAARAVRRAVTEREVDVVHTNGMRAHALLTLLPRGIATVASIRELPRSRLEAAQLRASLRAATVVVATSDYVRRCLPPHRDVRVIENPIAPPSLPDRIAARAALGIPADAFVVAMLAHFHWWKGHVDLLRAVEQLEGVWAVVAGGDLYGDSSRAYRDEVLEYARAGGFAHRVVSPGALADVGPVYAATDVVAHCSVRPEPFGRTIVEAMLARRPVVASAAGTPGEFVRHGVTGLLFDAGDYRALRRHLESLRGDPRLRARLADAAFDAVGDRFEPRRHAAAMHELYLSVAARPRREAAPTDGAGAPARRGRGPRLHPWSPVGRELAPGIEGGGRAWLVSRVGILNVGQRARAQLLARAVAELPRPSSIVDVGCGRGVNTFLLARWFPRARIVGVDVDEAALAVARRCAEAAGLDTIEFRPAAADLGAIPAADLVVCIDVLEHVGDDTAFARKLARLVAPGGSLVVHVPLRGQHYVFGSVRRSMLRGIEEGRDPHVREGYTETELRALLADAFERFDTARTLGGLTSVVADLEALGNLKRSRWPRLAGLPLLPLAPPAGGRWSKGVLGVGRGRRAGRHPSA